MTLQVAVEVAMPRDVHAAFHAASGEILAMVGPNGAGKTTLLRALAGLLRSTSGVVSLDGVVLDAPGAGIFVPPWQRAVGYVTQDDTLFPHMTVLDNVTFAIRSRVDTTRREARRSAGAWLEQVGLPPEAFGRRRPHELSGGEHQRVALARALASAPRLLLLDEPLQAVDPAARRELRRVLDQHLYSFAGVAIVVTHDPLDAMALADRVLVMEDGRLTDDGPPAALRTHPRSRFAADFVGLNLLGGRAEGTVVHLTDGGELVLAEPMEGPVLAVLHPRAIALYRQPPDGSPRNVWEAEVEAVEWTAGDRARVVLGGRVPLVAELTHTAVTDLQIAPGAAVWAVAKATEITAYPA